MMVIHIERWTMTHIMVMLLYMKRKLRSRKCNHLLVIEDIRLIYLEDCQVYED